MSDWKVYPKYTTEISTIPEDIEALHELEALGLGDLAGDLEGLEGWKIFKKIGRAFKKVGKGIKKVVKKIKWKKVFKIALPIAGVFAGGLFLAPALLKAGSAIIKSVPRAAQLFQRTGAAVPIRMLSKGAKKLVMLTKDEAAKLEKLGYKPGQILTDTLLQQVLGIDPTGRIIPEVGVTDQQLDVPTPQAKAQITDVSTVSPAVPGTGFDWKKMLPFAAAGVAALFLLRGKGDK